MIYDYICKNCGESKRIVTSSATPSNDVKCDMCGSPMRRNWKSSIMVGDSEKAQNIDDTSWVKEHMNIRPSGKTKVFY